MRPKQVVYWPKFVTRRRRVRRRFKTYGRLFLKRVKRQGCEVDQSPPSGAEIKNAWSYIFTPPYIFMVWCLIKHRDNFVSTFTT